jgi:hypothetical protein
MHTVIGDGPGLQETIASEHTSMKDIFDIQVSLYQADWQLAKSQVKEVDKLKTTAYIASVHSARPGSPSNFHIW